MNFDDLKIKQRDYKVMLRKDIGYKNIISDINMSNWYVNEIDSQMMYTPYWYFEVFP